MWSIEWSEEALNDMRSVPKEGAFRISRKLEQAAKNPPHFFTRLVGYDYWRLRVGDYRLIAVFQHAKKTVSIQKVGHRKGVYK